MSRQSSPWPSALAVCPRGREVSRTKNFLASQVASGSVAGRAALLHKGAVLLEKPEPFLQERSSPPTAP